MENKMQDQIEDTLHMNDMLAKLEKLSNSELIDKLKIIKYKQRDLKEHGLGDSDCEKMKYILQREYDMIMNIILFLK